MAKYRKIREEHLPREKHYWRNQVTALLNNGKIVTTEAKKQKKSVKLQKALLQWQFMRKITSKKLL